LNLKHDKLLSNFAFNCNLRHYTQANVRERNTFHRELAVMAEVGSSVQVEPRVDTAG